MEFNQDPRADAEESWTPPISVSYKEWCNMREAALNEGSETPRQYHRGVHFARHVLEFYGKDHMNQYVEDNFKAIEYYNPWEA